MKKFQIYKDITGYIRMAAFFAVIAAWASIPLFVQADDGPSVLPPVTIRTTTLNAPTGSTPRGQATLLTYWNGVKEFQASVNGLANAAGSLLNVYVDNASIGTITVDSNHSGIFDLRSDKNQTVPTINNGTVVQIRSGSIVLVSGTFPTIATPTPTPTRTPSPTPTRTPSPTPTRTPTPTPTPNPDLFAALTGPTIGGTMPIGGAFYDKDTDHTDLNVTVRQVNLPAGTKLNVVVNTTTIGTITLSNSGGTLNLDTRNGATIPAIVSGATIKINNGTTTVLSGTFGSVSSMNPFPTPTPFSFGRAFEAHLTGSGVTPPVNTTATGHVTVILSSNETQATVFGDFKGLSSNQTGARVETRATTPVTVFDLGVVGGTSGHFIPKTFAVTAAQAQQLKAGALSAVITTVNNSKGEIRGTLTQHSHRSDFNGDGMDDAAVFRPGTGEWYASNDDGVTFARFGTSTDKVVSGDYDGDGKTDIALFRPAGETASWEIERSSDGGTTSIAFGLSTDIPLRGDFDGDGRSDIAVYRPSTGVWYIQKSDGSGYQIQQFGAAEDKPMPADMDGDGVDDLVVFRPSTGVWYWQQSSDGKVLGMTWGMLGDIPVNADLDGDGRSDIAVFRPSTGMWFINRSSDGGFTALQWGLESDIPVAADYDGDGAADIAVFRPTEGIWYVLRSSDGASQGMQFGAAGDIPVMAP